MLHVLLHMARHEGAFTSEQIAGMLGTNPVVVRRTMAGLKRAGYVKSEKGHGGGWRIACRLDGVTILDVHEAVGGSNIFAIGNFSDNPECAVERAVNQALNGALEQAQALLLTSLRKITLAELAARFDSICTSEGWDAKGRTSLTPPSASSPPGNVRTRSRRRRLRT
jgi:DNA-binding IscR family transcriptional regulator